MNTHSTTSPFRTNPISAFSNSSRFKNAIKDGVAVAIGLLVLKTARLPLFAIERIPLKGIALAGGTLFLAASLGNLIIEAQNASSSLNDPSSNFNRIKACFNRVLLATFASLPIFAFHLAGRLSIAAPLPKISFREALALSTFGSFGLILPESLRFLSNEPGQKPIISCSKPQQTYTNVDCAPTQKPITSLSKLETHTHFEHVIEQRILEAFKNCEIQGKKRSALNFMKKFAHGFFFLVYQQKRESQAFLHLIMKKLDQEYFNCALWETFKIDGGNKVNLNEIHRTFFEIICQELAPIPKG